jgi:Uma2 family endonuclease
MTADEFLRWDDGTDTRHELVDGEIVAMAPPTDAHGSITGNAWGEIDARLRARPPCRATVEAGIRLDATNHYQADVAATCAETRGSLYVEAPFLIVEVISQSSERDDFGLKVHRYSLLPSVREIWLVDSRSRWVQVWKRIEDA